MKTIFKLTITLVALLLCAASSSWAGSPAGNLAGFITAGSTGKFLATPHSLTTEGYTDFAANIKLYRDGTATGEFTCAIPNVVVLAVIPTAWSVKADGSIQVTGNEYGYFDGAGYTDCPAIVSFRAGGI